MVGLVVSGWELELGCKRESPVCQEYSLGKRHKPSQIGPQFEHRLQYSAGDRSIGHIVNSDGENHFAGVEAPPYRSMAIVCHNGQL
jgi:hypothetical protein